MCIEFVDARVTSIELPEGIVTVLSPLQEIKFKEDWSSMERLASARIVKTIPS